MQFIKQHKNAFLLFILMFIQYGVLTLNTSSIANTNFLGLFLTDLVIAYLGFTILKKVEEANSPLEQFMYTFGGASGAQFAMLISLKFFHH